MIDYNKILLRKFMFTMALSCGVFLFVNLVMINVMECTPIADVYSKTFWAKGNMTLSHYTQLCKTAKSNIFYMSLLILVGPVGLFFVTKRILTKYDKELRNCLEVQGFRCIRCLSSISTDDAWYGGKEKKAWCHNCGLQLGFDKQ